MDWSRIKSYIIGLLILTNLILGIVLYKDQMSQNINQSDLINQVLSLLEEEDIYMSSEHLKEFVSMPKVKLNYNQPNMDRLALTLFDKDYTQIDNTYVDGYYSLTFDDNSIVYHYNGDRDEMQAPAEDRARQKAESFLYSLGIDMDDARLERVERFNEYYRLTYSQYSNDFFIEESNMVIEVSSDEIIYFERTWFDVTVSYNETLANIISVEESLFKLMTVGNETESQGREIHIIDMEMGYKLESSFTKQTIEGDASPYIRFVSADHQYFYIGAQK